MRRANTLIGTHGIWMSCSARVTISQLKVSSRQVQIEPWQVRWYIGSKQRRYVGGQISQESPIPLLSLCLHVLSSKVIQIRHNMQILDIVLNLRSSHNLGPPYNKIESENHYVPRLRRSVMSGKDMLQSSVIKPFSGRSWNWLTQGRFGLGSTLLQRLRYLLVCKPNFPLKIVWCKFSVSVLCTALIFIHRKTKYRLRIDKHTKQEKKNLFRKIIS